MPLSRCDCYYVCQSRRNGGLLAKTHYRAILFKRKILPATSRNRHCIGHIFDLLNHRLTPHCPHTDRAVAFEGENVPKAAWKSGDGNNIAQPRRFSVFGPSKHGAITFKSHPVVPPGSNTHNITQRAGHFEFPASYLSSPRDKSAVIFDCLIVGPCRSD